MKLSVLISDPKISDSEKLKEFLDGKNIELDCVTSGKECQLRVYKKEYALIILDLETKNNSSLEVIRYIKANKPACKLIITAPSKSTLESLAVTEEQIKDYGITNLYYKPFDLEKIIEDLEGKTSKSYWKKMLGQDDVKKNKVSEPVEVQEEDQKFTGLALEEFCIGNIALFNLYLKKDKNLYLRIAEKSDVCSIEQINKHMEQFTDKNLYFHCTDRALYVNFCNDFLRKIHQSGKGTSELKIQMLKNLVDKYLEEVYQQGLSNNLIEEGKKISETIYLIVENEAQTDQLVNKIDMNHQLPFMHQFLTSLYSTIICKNLDWSTQRTTEIIAFGGLLHDIGLLKIPANLRQKNENELKDDALKTYQEHPLRGKEYLDKFEELIEPVKQVVYQHHEYVNGSGYPNRLTGLKIYPLAKVLSFADAFSEILIRKKCNPTQGIKELISDKMMVQRFDPLVVKALIVSFIKK